jgi:quinol monooxygenase YgiN
MTLSEFDNALGACIRDFVDSHNGCVTPPTSRVGTLNRKGGGVYTRLFYATIQPGQDDEAMTVVNSILPKIRESEGCLHVQILKGGEDLVGITDWASTQALSAYADGEVAKELFTRLTPLLMGVPTTRSYDMIVNI